MDWEVNFGIGCGPLRFGMTKAQVSEILGPPDEHIAYNDGEIRNDAGWRECSYLDGRLVCLDGEPSRLENLRLAGTNLLSLPILSAVDVLNEANGSIGQAQGGSLYFEEIGVALLQFEHLGIRQILLFAPGYDHGEPLMRLTLADVEAYYREQAETIPESDILGAAQ